MGRKYKGRTGNGPNDSSWDKAHCDEILGLEMWHLDACVRGTKIAI
jgi:hypothetical protein